MIIDNFYKNRIAIIGLGYVGLPLLLEFSKKFTVTGFDINKKRIKNLNIEVDTNKDINLKNRINNKKITLTSNEKLLNECNIYIVTVPTPLRKNNSPNLKPLKDSTKLLSKYLNKNDLIIYESTVFPGAIEEICVPLINKISKLIYNVDYFCGYSPERINPGDKIRTLTNIKKITSGSNSKVANFVDKLYKTIIKAGTYKVKSIKIAEAAKVIENTQRDLNIALFNELSKIFNILNLDTKEIIDAASTKWNFVSFKPGLVGGHCIGVDPYYLTYKSKSIGYNPEVILSGRKINDSMGEYVAKNFYNKLIQRHKNKKNFKILIMGFSFKENCSDIRNTKVIDIVRYLQNKNIYVDVYDPYVDKSDIKKIKKINFTRNLKEKYYDGVIIAVAHRKFKKMSIFKIKNLCNKNKIIYDLKSIFPSSHTDMSL